jgi:hypothetical protein
MAVFREERDDLEMVRHAFLPYMVSEGYLFPNIIFSSSPLRVGTNFGDCMTNGAVRIE